MLTKNLLLSSNLLKRWHPSILTLNHKRNTSKISNNETNTPNWVPFYKLPLARLISAFNKLKLYQAAVTSIGVPVSMFLESNAAIPLGSSELFGAIGITGTLTLFAAGIYTKNVIGFGYVNKNNMEQIRLAYIDFWGNRKNIDFHIDDLTTTQAKMSFNFWITVKSKEESFKLMHRHGKILDSDKFTHYFGEY